MEKFWFGHEDYDFWPLYEAIKKYYPIDIPYPIGVTSDWDDYEKIEKFYKSYPGCREVQQLITDNKFNATRFEEQWGVFLNQLSEELRAKVDTMGIANPCFGGILSLGQKVCGNVTSDKELHFAVSLLGPFYTIYGVDSTTLALDEEALYMGGPKQLSHYTSINAITTSPYQEYEEAFNKVEQKLKERYPGYRMVPYYIGIGQINGLQVPHSENHICTIFNGLFHGDLDLNRYDTRGDQYYGDDEWRNDKYQD